MIFFFPYSTYFTTGRALIPTNINILIHLLTFIVYNQNSFRYTGLVLVSTKYVSKTKISLVIKI